jgi:CheY-like chemotaxis protein
MLRVLLIEDDYLYANWLEKEIRISLGVDVEEVTTEHGFHLKLGEIVENPPDVIVMDIMLRWADPAPDMPIPPVDLGSFHRAGLRCLCLLRADKTTRSTPVILYSNLDESDIVHEMRELGLAAPHVPKSSNAKVILDQIQSLLPPRRPKMEARI